MNSATKYRVLLVEDSSSDVLLLKDALGTADVEYDLVHVERLDRALGCLQREAFDLVLLDLGLPDSNGVDTVVRLRQSAPAVPILVLTALNDPAVGLQTVRRGAQDYFVKQNIRAEPVSRAVRYAIERAQAVHRTEETRQREEQTREIQGMMRLAEDPPTSVTAQMYSASPLREVAPEDFSRMVREYKDFLGCAVEERLFKVDHKSQETLQALADYLGSLRAGPRDVVEIHSLALREKINGVGPGKAAAFLEEGRLAVLGLMGHLVAHYRRHVRASRPKKAQTEGAL
jgi:CheY-like chemotaxis protein